MKKGKCPICNNKLSLVKGTKEIRFNCSRCGWHKESKLTEWMMAL